jgi:antitoxin component YwqK of YwqJK toxin-antitoxin module
MKYIFIILFISFKIYSQDILDYKQIYSKNYLAYRNDNDELFTGKIQKTKHKNHIVFEAEFQNGHLLKNTTYFNGKEKIISDEKFYNLNWKIIKHIKYSLDNNYLWLTYYEDNGYKKLEEDYDNGKLVYKCEYLNNKKNGVSFSINKKGELKECKWANGKYIK